MSNEHSERDTEMPTTEPWYDTKEGLTKQVELGLTGLHLIDRERHEAGYERRERMSEWIVLGRFFLDSAGNFGPMIKGAPADVSDKTIPKVMTRRDGGSYSPEWTTTHQVCLPTIDARCDRCLYGWTLKNIGDFVARRDKPARHQTCQRLARVEETQAYFRDIFEKARIGDALLRAIPNEYCPCDLCGPWFIAETVRGPIRIGRRKRVISIEWGTSAITAKGDRLFGSEDVTVGPQLVHAWGREKATEYLQRLVLA